MRPDQHPTAPARGWVDPTPALVPFSGLLGHAGGGRSGLLRLPVRVVRKILKRLLSPWFDLQTRFNHTLIGVLAEQTHQGESLVDAIDSRVAEAEARVADELRGELARHFATVAVQRKALTAGAEALAARVRELEAANAALRDEARQSVEASNQTRVAAVHFARLAEARAHDEIEAVRDGLAEEIADARAEWAAAFGKVRWAVRAAGTARALAFAVARLPEPPARVLQVGPWPLDLAVLGFATDFADSLPDTIQFDDASFDCVCVTLQGYSDAGLSADRELMRRLAGALAPEGRVLLAAVGYPDDIAAGFRVVERDSGLFVLARG